jgi:hypothetical protein
MISHIHLRCHHCSHDFGYLRTGRGRNPRTCSDECRRARNRTMQVLYRKEHTPSPRKLLRKQCVICKIPFETPNNRTRCCGIKCGVILSHRLLRERARERNTRYCAHCAKPFIPANPSAPQRRAGHRQKFCSVTCAADTRRIYASKSERRRAERQRARLRRASNAGTTSKGEGG